ncbi:hypothetical protein [Lacrimispora amygdalina]|uniref:hypothetical protein n=1 Tax=Lacrimispora amygdalina TaxID=253257 RepID=UPI000BE45D5B|nr:hypothetical protein [Lacrimispora amygdalina]
MNDRGKKRKHLLALVLCVLAVFQLAMESKADMEPSYNIAVKLDPAVIAYLNEKIEVYCEKDGQFYMSIDLNKSNHYEYKKIFVNGVYTFRARVRYDMNEEYTILPDSQTIELTYKNNNSLYEIVFTIEGAREDPEEHSNLTDNKSEQGSDMSQEEKIYSADDIDELYEIQESMLAEAEEAFTEQEVWEQNHNFLSKNGVSDQKSPTMENENLPMHVYPESEENMDQTEKSLVQTPSATEKKSMEESQDQTSTSIKTIGLWVLVIVALFLALVLVVIISEKGRSKHE